MTDSNTKATRRMYLVLIGTAGLMAIVVAALRARPGSRFAAAVTIALVLDLTIRFRYVIALLTWPPTPIRLTLLGGFWIALVHLAWRVTDPTSWLIAAAGLFVIGIAIEVQNLVTRQWEIGSAPFQRTLRNDILRGIAAASIGTIVVLAAARWRPGWAAPVVGALVLADVARLTEMVVRHRRFTRPPSS